MTGRLYRRLYAAASSERAFFALLYAYTAVGLVRLLLERRRSRRG